jgi:hypothetical protein
MGIDGFILQCGFYVKFDEDLDLIRLENTCHKLLLLLVAIQVKI